MSSNAAPLLEVRDLEKEFTVRNATRGAPREVVQAVSGVSFDLYPGEVLSIVGESGCGKSTTGRCILRLIEPTRGSVTYRGEDLLATSQSKMRRLRGKMQIVFQDPYTSLHPRRRVRDIIAEPMIVQGANKTDAGARVRELMQLVQLDPSLASRYPHEFSGGQRQRIGIARALALEPEILVLDEPVSALDVSVQASILNLLADLRDELGVSYVFIAHDLSVVRHVADRIAVMYLGRIAETGRADEVYGAPSHPYSQALLSSVPLHEPHLRGQKDRILLQGDVPSPANPPSGCRFRTRCWKAQDICAVEPPALIDRGQGHPSACHFAEARTVVPVDAE